MRDVKTLPQKRATKWNVATVMAKSTNTTKIIWNTETTKKAIPTPNMAVTPKDTNTPNSTMTVTVIPMNGITLPNDAIIKNTAVSTTNGQKTNDCSPNCTLL